MALNRAPKFAGVSILDAKAHWHCGLPEESGNE